MLPGNKITFENGNFGIVATNPDGICGIVSSAVAVALTFLLNKHYVIYSLKDAEALGIVNSVGNHELYKTIAEFYDEAGIGTELWIYGVAKTRTLDQLITDSTALLDASNRRISAVILKYAPSAADTETEDGLREGFPATLLAAQTLADSYTAEKIHPIVFFIEGYNFTGVAQDLLGFSEGTNNRVCVMIGDTETRTGIYASKGAAVGVLGGRFAKNQVHVQVGRVKDGALKPLQFFINDTPIEQYNVTALHDKGFVTLRTHVGKSGYYLSHGLMACTVEDDYRHLARRRVIDKAFRLANGTLTNYILDDFNLTSDGKLSAIDCQSIEAEIERVIAQEMSAKGELSVDVTVQNDTGVKALVDRNERIAVTGIIRGQIQVKPKGYSEYNEFTIGYNINS
jgi:hypothetical protein